MRQEGKKEKGANLDKHAQRFWNQQLQNIHFAAAAKISAANFRCAAWTEAQNTLGFTYEHESGSSSLFTYTKNKFIP